jgi:hypothetical protein
MQINLWVVTSLVLFVLKAIGIVAISWWLVAAPAVIFFILSVIGGLLTIVVEVLEAEQTKRSK